MPYLALRLSQSPDDFDTWLKTEGDTYLEELVTRHSEKIQNKFFNISLSL